ncbi:MAG: DUF4416 family protein [Candidatus Omnitrophica bacterium]|nr:DUF4416 family protein [Candidatus Omnitrophota bacterium]MBD3269556.1 DUF4416 family protein [Candidatus Omnitrophota bacterium]
MLSFHPPLPVKFICGLIYRKESVYNDTKKNLVKRYGPLDFESEKIDFDFTDYYTDEMGKPLFRRFLSFRKLREADTFVKVKLFCVKLEKKFSKDKRRSINIDPGYLDDAKLVLLTTKDFYHRIYLERGIFAETTLYYSGKDFQEFSTTFPDYRTRKYKDIFLNIRNLYQKDKKWI